MELKNRERKVDTNKMSIEQATLISDQVGEKIRQICDEAIEKANRLLNIYGITAKMQIVIDHPELTAQEESKKE